MTEHELSLLKEVYKGDRLEQAIKEVEGGCPLAYAMGRWYFYDITLLLDEHCLIPQPDTEHVVEWAIKLLPQGAHFCDLGTGTGCIAISILKHRPDTTALLCDISPEALEYAHTNAKLNGVEERCTFVIHDMLKPFEGERFDAVISNPPYIRSEVIPTLSHDVLCEPKLALDGGVDGMDYYRGIFAAHKNEINSDGIFIFEIGYDQASDIVSICEQNGYYDHSIYKDYGANDRVCIAKKAKEKKQ